MKLKRLEGAMGVDEAGRGPLAGPVVAAAVVLPRGFRCPGLNDSKQVSPRDRERMSGQIRAQARWSVMSVDVPTIDRINILRATFEAMRRAVSDLEGHEGAVYVDGNLIPPGLPYPAEAVVDGDAKIAAIAAASILAKTQRDRFMREAALEFPEYGFERHFGYATPEHLEALRRWGPCPLHRRSFSPCREESQLCLTFAE